MRTKRLQRRKRNNIKNKTQRGRGHSKENKDLGKALSGETSVDSLPLDLGLFEEKKKLSHSSKKQSSPPIPYNIDYYELMTQFLGANQRSLDNLKRHLETIKVPGGEKHLIDRKVTIEKIMHDAQKRQTEMEKRFLIKTPITIDSGKLFKEKDNYLEALERVPQYKCDDSIKINELMHSLATEIKEKERKKSSSIVNRVKKSLSLKAPPVLTGVAGISLIRKKHPNLSLAEAQELLEKQVEKSLGKKGK